MKAYKFSRSIYTWHWSQSVSENIIFIPDVKIAFYNGSSSGKNYKGITSEEKIIEEAEQYIKEVLNGTIKQYKNDEHKEMTENPVKDKMYATDILMLRDRTYVKEIPEQKIAENRTAWPITLLNFQEIELNTTEEELQKLIDAQNEFTTKKSAFEAEQKKFEDSLDNINNLIKTE